MNRVAGSWTPPRRGAVPEIGPLIAGANEVLATLADWALGVVLCSKQVVVLWFDINAPSLFAPFLQRKHELAFNARRLLGNLRIL